MWPFTKKPPNNSPIVITSDRNSVILVIQKGWLKSRSADGLLRLLSEQHESNQNGSGGYPEFDIVPDRAASILEAVEAAIPVHHGADQDFVGALEPAADLRCA
jgi:hypothetical protein